MQKRTAFRSLRSKKVDGNQVKTYTADKLRFQTTSEEYRFCQYCFKLDQEKLEEVVVNMEQLLPFMATNFDFRVKMFIAEECLWFFKGHRNMPNGLEIMIIWSRLYNKKKPYPIPARKPTSK